MRVKTLNLSYRLTGEDIENVEVGSERDVEHTLRDAGILGERFSGMGVFESEWILSRTFALEAVFDAGEWECERAYLEFEWLDGAGRAFVNGIEVGAFFSGACTLDITQAIQAGANALRMEFAPVDDKRAGTRRGMRGDVRLRGCWSLHIDRFLLSPCANGISARVATDAFAAGRYVFKYLLSRDDEPLGTFSFEQRLGAKHEEIAHTLNIDALPGACRVLLSVMRAGDECDSREGWTRICESAERAAASADDMPCIAISDGERNYERLSMLLKAGVRAFFIKGKAFLPEKFLREADAAGAYIMSMHAAPTPHACIYPYDYMIEPAWRRFTGMQKVAPPQKPLPLPAFKALGGGRILDMQPDEWLGAGALSDIARLSGIMRYIQALKTAYAAKYTSPAFDIGGGFGLIASDDLFDEGRPRPAYYALKSALRDAGVYADCDMRVCSANEQTGISIFVCGGVFERVSAELYDEDGRLVGRAVFGDCAPGRAGEFTFTPGGQCRIMLMRISGLIDGETYISDCPIIIRAEHELEAFLRARPATLRRMGQIYENTSHVIAFGTARLDGGGALLPGEASALYSAEGVNVYAYDSTGA